MHLASEVLPLWRAAQLETGDPDTPLPYWAFAWIGGLALGRHLSESPAVVRGLRVLDLGAGSGLVGICAALAGASEVAAADIDPFAHAAIRLNAAANRCSVRVVTRDLLEEPPPDVDVILAGDCWYEEALAARVTLGGGRSRGGDPGARRRRRAAGTCRSSGSRRSPRTRCGPPPSSRTWRLSGATYSRSGRVDMS